MSGAEGTAALPLRSNNPTLLRASLSDLGRVSARERPGQRSTFGPAYLTTPHDPTAPRPHAHPTESDSDGDVPSAFIVVQRGTMNRDCLLCKVPEKYTPESV